MPGASIYILNTHYGASADATGKFEIKNINAGTYRLKITAVGYATQIKTVTLSSENVNLEIELLSAGNSLDEVIVTAQKTEEEVQKIPLAISTISAKQVQEYRLWNSKEISAIVPNLYSANPGDERNVTSIRGITSTSYDPAVATYIDGVNQFSLDTYIPQLIDVERIEVLRGPQGTLYGRNAMGGVINIITKQPTNQIKGFAEVSVGSFGQQRYTLGIKLPLIKDKLFFGASGLYEHRDGFYHNDYNNTSFEQFHNGTGNYFLKYLISSKWSVTANFKHSQNRNNGAFSLGFIGDTSLAPFHVNQNAITKTIDNTLNGSLAINYYGNEIDFSSISAYQSNYRYYENPIDADFSPKDSISIINNYGGQWNKSQAATQEFKISSSSKNKQRFNWTLGSYLFYQQAPVKTSYQIAFAPNVYFTQTNIYNSFNTGLAMYGQASYSFTEKT